MTQSYQCRSVADTVRLGEQLALQLRPGDIILLEGPLGSGKTTLVKGIARSLGVEAEITSPSYPIVSEYSGRCDLYHVDLYRIESFAEFEALGLDDVMYSSNITLIEWGEKLRDRLPGVRGHLVISIGPDLSRTVGVDGLSDVEFETSEP